MFYNKLTFPDGDKGRSFGLVKNFLKNAKSAIEELSDSVIKYDLKTNNILDDIGDGSNSFNIAIKESFADLPSIYSKFLNELKKDKDLLYKKLEDVGLTGEIIEAKFSLLDWWHSKVQETFKNIKNPKNENVFDAFLNLLWSILISICNALGIDLEDIYNEGKELLKSLYKAIYA